MSAAPIRFHDGAQQGCEPRVRLAPELTIL
jgi:hypothetical protein